MQKTTFALFLGNRGFFPASLIAEARSELPRMLKEWGYGVLMLNKEATRYSAVETSSDGETCANSLRIGRNRFRHHVSLTPGQVQAPLCEAEGHYLGFGVTELQRE